MASNEHMTSPGELRTVDYLLVSAASAMLVFVLAGLGAALIPEPGVRSDARLDRLTTVPVSNAAAPVLRESVEARPGGSYQRVDVDASSGDLAPNHFRVSQGTPVEMWFSGGRGHTSRVAFESLGVSVDLGNGPVVVRLPALEPGAYPLTDSYGEVAGLLVAE